MGVAVEVVRDAGRRRSLRIALVVLTIAVLAQAAAAGAKVAVRLIAGELPPPSPSTGSAALHAGRALPTPLVLGYYDGGGVGSSGWYDLVRDQGRLNGIIPAWYEIWGQGQITGSADPGVMRYARAHGLWVFALVQQTQDPAVFRTLLGNRASAARARAHLLRLVTEGGYDGVNLDFEGVAAADRAAFTRFVWDLTALFHAHGYYVTVSVPAETADEPANAWTGAYDYRALGRIADLVMPMAYDDHYSGGPPGSVAPVAWVRAVAAYAVRAMPADKVVLGLPAYGYDWGATRPALALSYAQAIALDDAYARGRAGAHFAYDAGGVVHQVYFEDGATFLAQSQIAVDYELRGIVLWRLGIEDPAIWQLLVVR
jgi:spore germination protein